MVEMEQNITSFRDDSVMQMTISCLDRKRKFEAEQLGIPPSKHSCGSQILALGRDTITTQSHVPFRNVISEGDMFVMTNKADYSEVESAKDSNSIVTTDTDSLMSTLCDAETNVVHFTSSSKRSSDSYSCGLYSLASRSLTNSGPERSGSVLYTDIDHDFGVHLPLNIEEHFLASGSHIDSYGKMELEELLIANEVTAESSALVSGDWTVDKDSKGNTEKLTIDKEFENYFSALML